MPDDVVVPAPAPAPASAEPEIPEARLRAYVREKYGVEDDPDTWKTKHREVVERASRADAAEQRASQYEAYIRAAQAQQPRQVVPPLTAQPSETDMRELARIDPYEAYQRMFSREREQWQSLLARHARGVDELVQAREHTSRIQQQFLTRLQEEYPEAYDGRTTLHKRGAEIYRDELSPEQRNAPNGAYIAARMAAAEIGLMPKAKRGASAVDPSELAGQSVDRGSRRPSPAEVDAPKLSDREKHIAEVMGVDAKVMAQAKSAKANKQNLRGGA